MRIALLFLMTWMATYKTAQCQTTVTVNDSTEIKTQIEGFYTWYIDIAKRSKLSSEFNPNFAKRNNGMTTLDFTNYKAGLIKYNFTGCFIKQKIDEYKECEANLNKIPFDKFSRFTDLDDFENIECDFSNHYEWTGGMEIKDNASLSRLTKLKKKSIVGYVDFFSDDNRNSGAIVNFKKVKGQWMIKDLELVK